VSLLWYFVLALVVLGVGIVGCLVALASHFLWELEQEREHRFDD